MRPVFSRLFIAAGWLSLACATAVEDDLGPNRANAAGAHAGSTALSSAGKTGGSNTAFGGAASAGGAPNMNRAGSSAGGSSPAGAASGGAAKSGGAGTSGGKAMAGSETGGVNAAGTAAGGGSSSAGGPGAIGCSGVALWSSKPYALGDTTADTCNGPFSGACPVGQAHQFECNPAAGAIALAWCEQREPGVGNGWPFAWVDQGACE
jgi:hypothetical protein